MPPIPTPSRRSPRINSSPACNTRRKRANGNINSITQPLLTLQSSWTPAKNKSPSRKTSSSNPSSTTEEKKEASRVNELVAAISTAPRRRKKNNGENDPSSSLSLPSLSIASTTEKANDASAKSVLPIIADEIFSNPILATTSTMSRTNNHDCTTTTATMPRRMNNEDTRKPAAVDRVSTPSKAATTSKKRYRNSNSGDSSSISSNDSTRVQTPSRASAKTNNATYNNATIKTTAAETNSITSTASTVKMRSTPKSRKVVPFLSLSDDDDDDDEEDEKKDRAKKFEQVSLARKSREGGGNDKKVVDDTAASTTAMALTTAIAAAAATPTATIRTSSPSTPKSTNGKRRNTIISSPQSRGSSSSTNANALTSPPSKADSITTLSPNNKQPSASSQNDTIDPPKRRREKVWEQLEVNELTKKMPSRNGSFAMMEKHSPKIGRKADEQKTLFESNKAITSTATTTETKTATTTATTTAPATATTTETATTTAPATTATTTHSSPLKTSHESANDKLTMHDTATPLTSSAPSTPKTKNGKRCNIMLSPRSRGSAVKASVLASPSIKVDSGSATMSPNKQPSSSPSLLSLLSKHEDSPIKRRRSTMRGSTAQNNNIPFAMSLQSYGVAIANSLSSPNGVVETHSPNGSSIHRFVSPSKRSSAELALQDVARATRAGRREKRSRVVDDIDEYVEGEEDGHGSGVNDSGGVENGNEKKGSSGGNVEKTVPDATIDEMVDAFMRAGTISMNRRYDEQWLRNFKKWTKLQSPSSNNTYGDDNDSSPLPIKWVQHQRTCYRHFRQRKKTAMNEAKIALLEGAGFSWGKVMKANVNESDVDPRDDNVQRHKGEEMTGELNSGDDAVGNSSKLPAAAGNEDIADGKKRTGRVEGGCHADSTDQRKSARKSCPTNFYHDTLEANKGPSTSIPSSPSTNDAVRGNDNKIIKKTANLPKATNDEQSNMYEQSSVSVTSANKQQSPSKKRASATLTESLASLSNDWVSIKQKSNEPELGEESVVPVRKSMTSEKQKHEGKKKRRGGRHSMSSFFVLEAQTEETNKNSKRNKSSAILSHKKLEDQLRKKKAKPLKRKSDGKVAEKAAIAKKQKLSSKSSDATDEFASKRQEEEVSLKPALVPKPSEVETQLHESDEIEQESIPIQIQKPLETSPLATTKDFGLTESLNIAKKQKLSSKSSDATDEIASKRQEEEVSLEPALVPNPSEVETQLHESDEIEQCQESIPVQIQKPLETSPLATTNDFDLTESLNIASFSPLSLTSPLRTTNLHEVSFNKGTPESLKNSSDFVPPTSTANGGGLDILMSVDGVSVSTGRNEASMKPIEDQLIAANTSQYYQSQNAALAFNKSNTMIPAAPTVNYVAVPVAPCHVESQHKMIMAEKLFQEKMAEFGRLEFEAKMVAQRMRKIEERMMDIDSKAPTNNGANHQIESSRDSMKEGHASLSREMIHNAESRSLRRERFTSESNDEYYFSGKRRRKKTSEEMQSTIFSERKSESRSELYESSVKSMKVRSRSRQSRGVKDDVGNRRKSEMRIEGSNYEHPRERRAESHERRHARSEKFYASPNKLNQKDSFQKKSPSHSRNFQSSSKKHGKSERSRGAQQLNDDIHESRNPKVRPRKNTVTKTATNKSGVEDVASNVAKSEAIPTERTLVTMESTTIEKGSNLDGSASKTEQQKPINSSRDPLYWLAGGENSSDDESWDFDGPMILPPNPL